MRSNDGGIYSKDRVTILTTIFHDKVDGLLNRLDVEDFVDHLHRLMFAAFTEMDNKEIPFEIQAFHALLETPDYAKEKRKCGVHEGHSLTGAADIVLAEFINPANFEYYFRKLRSDRMRRWILRLSDQVKEKALNPLIDPLDTLRWAEQQSAKATRKSKLEVEV